MSFWRGERLQRQFVTASVLSELIKKRYNFEDVLDFDVRTMVISRELYYPPSDHLSQSTGGYTYPDQYGGWMDPAMAYAMHHHQQQYYGQAQSYSEAAAAVTETTPFKFDPDSSNTMSPSWAHLDQATIAMGLATPAQVSPSTPRRLHGTDQAPAEQEGTDEYPGFNHAQAPLLRQQYYGVFDAVPPSPATQFMMPTIMGTAFRRHGCDAAAVATLSWPLLITIAWLEQRHRSNWWRVFANRVRPIPLTRRPKPSRWNRRRPLSYRGEMNPSTNSTVVAHTYT